MRSHNFARTMLRCAGRNIVASQSSTPLRVSAQTFRSGLSYQTPAISAPRAFSSSSVSQKKKAKKNVIEEEDAFEEQQNDDDDDLFGGVSSTSPASSSSSTSAVASSISRADFALALSEYRASLEWEMLDRGQFPSLVKWRFLASNADTPAEFAELLDLASIYRDRVGSLGVESGWRLAFRASSKRLPEVALNAFLDRYRFGLEYDMESLMVVQEGLVRKLGRRNREEILQSAEVEGCPVQEVDLLGVIGGGEGEGEEGKAEAIAEHHELDMPLARAQLSIIDRMCLLASLSTNLSATASIDPVLLSYVTRAYIQTFHLDQSRSKSRSNPLLTNIFTRTDNLVSLLTSSAQRSISSSSTPSQSGAKHISQSQRSAALRRNLRSTLSYVAVRGQGGFKDAHGKGLDPVRTLYRLMETVDRSQSGLLVRKVEPLLQSYQSL
ncbi:hypothetical protein PHSY_004853 [Pseudozyma hubeiensis SY62]|uniref:Uncharacterized protein n=1 Tax=Pseudozyma hubeiensis (strain SY62) TaxID=1305764 RepID=R9P7A1_PSEHS|nr:hypothetical protein PHSY_004853 [Pseudozyma hubeiensis SY62]GAC97268.1 hypothetical protein PHSY_004853 [Pseudozyma hubeiensis SY62]